MTWLLIAFHIIMVTAVYWTAYRSGYKAGLTVSRRQVEASTAPLTEILEKLNLDPDEFLNDKRPED